MRAGHLASRAAAVPARRLLTYGEQASGPRARMVPKVPGIRWMTDVSCCNLHHNLSRKWQKALTAGLPAASSSPSSPRLAGRIPMPRKTLPGRAGPARTACAPPVPGWTRRGRPPRGAGLPVQGRPQPRRRATEAGRPGDFPDGKEYHKAQAMQAPRMADTVGGAVAAKPCRHRSPRPRSMPKVIDREAWIGLGLRGLGEGKWPPGAAVPAKGRQASGEGGGNSPTIEEAGEALGVTRSSFNSYFGNIATYHTEICKRWAAERKAVRERDEHQARGVREEPPAACAAAAPPPPSPQSPTIRCASGPPPPSCRGRCSARASRRRR